MGFSGGSPSQESDNNRCCFFHLPHANVGNRPLEKRRMAIMEPIYLRRHPTSCKLSIRPIFSNQFCLLAVRSIDRLERTDNAPTSPCWNIYLSFACPLENKKTTSSNRSHYICVFWFQYGLVPMERPCACRSFYSTTLTPGR